MAKKKKKFKKKISQNLSERIAQAEAEKPLLSPESKSPEVQKSPIKPKEDTSSADKYAYVRRDIKRDFIIIGVLLLILAATAVVDAKTGYLKQVADWIYTTLNLKV